MGNSQYILLFEMSLPGIEVLIEKLLPKTLGRLGKENPSKRWCKVAFAQRKCAQFQYDFHTLRTTSQARLLVTACGAAVSVVWYVYAFQNCLVRVSTAVWYATKCGVTSHDTSFNQCNYLFSSENWVQLFSSPWVCSPSGEFVPSILAMPRQPLRIESNMVRRAWWQNTSPSAYSPRSCSVAQEPKARGLRCTTSGYARILPSSPIRTMLDLVSNTVHSVGLHDTQRHTILPHFKQSTVMTHKSLVDVDGKVSSCQVGASKIYGGYCRRKSRGRYQRRWL